MAVNSESGDECVSSSECSVTNVMFERREFLFGTAAAVTSLVLPDGSQAQAQTVTLERTPIMKLSNVRENAPVEFQYPTKHKNATNTLVRLSEPAGGGVGPNKSIVAFNNLCTHLGASMTKTFDGRWALPARVHCTGPRLICSRHGMVISGHATLSLPQILLEVEGDDIFAVGCRD